MKIKRTQLNQSVEKTIHLIEFMANKGQPVRLQEITSKIGMPASTVSRLLNTLYTYGYINQDPITLRYSLSLKISQLGSLISSQININEIARQWLLEISEICKESTCLSIEQDMEVVYTDVVDGPDGLLRTTQRIGKRAPMHCTGTGKIFLSEYNDKQLTQFINTKGLSSYTPNTIITPDDLRQELEKIRAQGYAIDDEECEIGVRCIASGIKDYSGKIIAGISISGPISRISKDNIDKFIKAIMDTAAKISAHLAYKD